MMITIYKKDICDHNKRI